MFNFAPLILRFMKQLGRSLLLTLLAPMLLAQESDPNHFRVLEVRGHSGTHLYTGEALKEVLQNGYGAAQVRYGWQSSDAGGWQSSYQYPIYGLGWYTAFIGDPEVLGTPGAFFGFVSFPLYQYRRHRMFLEPSLGLSYDFEPYNPETNVHNDAIGSRFNVYFALNLGAAYRLNREMDLVYGLDLTHFSNGRTFRPNKGLNLAGLNLGFRYHFNKQQNLVDNRLHPETILPVRPNPQVFLKAEPLHVAEFLVYGAGGVVQNDEDKGTDKQYVTFSSFVEYRYHFNSKSAVVVGLDGFYDNSLRASYPNKPHHFYGTHLGYDYSFWLLSFRMQAGTYLHSRGHDYKGAYFFRPALQLRPGKSWFVQVGLKTQAGFKADWVEYGLGLRLPR